jgi:hypothetical protein
MWLLRCHVMNSLLGYGCFNVSNWGVIGLELTGGISSLWVDLVPISMSSGVLHYPELLGFQASFNGVEKRLRLRLCGA